MDLEMLWLFVRRFHIGLGFVGLVAFWLAIVARKGGRFHIVAGRVFEWSGYAVAGSALFTCARYLLTPHHFAFVSRPGESAEELARIQFAQFFLTMLAFLAWLFLVQLRNGVRVVQTRQQPAEVYRNWEAHFWLYSQLAGSVVLMGYGAYRLATGGSSVHWLSVLVPLIPLAEFRKERLFLLQPRETKMSWWYKHMECMLGCGIAFHTAGLVFTTRWLQTNWQLQLPGMWQLLPWILPTAVGVPLTHIWIRWYRKKFGDLPREEVGVVKQELV